MRRGHGVPRIKHTDCRIRSAGWHRDLASKLVVGMCQARPGTDLGFGSVFDPLMSSAWVLVPGTSMRSFISLSCSREDDRLADKRLVPVLITPEENADTFSPSFSLGSCRSRGRPSRYSQRPPSAQSAATSPADLLAQGVSAQIHAAMLEPALLPGPGMPAASPPLAGDSPPGETSSRRWRQRPACPG
jgi:hypothetical protein